MFDSSSIKDVVEKGGTVEYRGNSICHLERVLDYPIKTDTPYQVNLAKSKYNKNTREYEGDALYNGIEEATEHFIEACGKS